MDPEYLKKLEFYIYHYLVEKDMKHTAEDFKMEANLNPDDIWPIFRKGYLAEWWAYSLYRDPDPMVNHIKEKYGSSSQGILNAGNFPHDNLQPVMTIPGHPDLPQSANPVILPTPGLFGPLQSPIPKSKQIEGLPYNQQTENQGPNLSCVPLVGMPVRGPFNLKLMPTPERLNMMRELVPTMIPTPGLGPTNMHPNVIEAPSPAMMPEPKRPKMLENVGPIMIPSPGLPHTVKAPSSTIMLNAGLPNLIKAPRPTVMPTPGLHYRIQASCPTTMPMLDAENLLQSAPEILKPPSDIDLNRFEPIPVQNLVSAKLHLSNKSKCPAQSKLKIAFYAESLFCCCWGLVALFLQIFFDFRYNAPSSDLWQLFLAL